MLNESHLSSLQVSNTSTLRNKESTYVNAEINCSNCQKYVMKTALKFTCSHILCISCVSLELLKEGLSPLETISSNLQIKCFCTKGTCDIPIDTLLKLLSVNEDCIKHGEDKTCPQCVVWASQFTRLKMCELHQEQPYSHYCKTCKYNICSTCLSNHQDHKIIDLDSYSKEIDQLKENKFLYKNYKEFLNSFTNIEKGFNNTQEFEYNKIITKLDDLILKLNNIKTRYLSIMNGRKAQLNQIISIIKYIYYYYYKSLFAKENDYYVLNFLHQNKYELDGINLLSLSSLSNSLSQCTNIIDHIDIESFDYKINVRNTYSYVSSEYLGHEGYVFSLIQLNKKLLVSCSEDKRIIIWDVDRNEKMKEIEKAHNSAVYSLCKLKHKKQFVSGSFAEIKVWSSETFEPIGILKGHMDYVVNMKMIKLNLSASTPDLYNANKNALASCSFDKTVKIWDINYFRCLFTLKGHLGNVNSIVQYDNDYSQLITCSYDKTIKFWDIKEEKCIVTLEQHDSPIYAMIVLKDGRLATGSYKDIKLWNCKEKKCEWTFTERNMGVYYFVQIDDGRLASCSFKSINFWDVKENRWIYSLDQHMNFVTFLLIMKDGRLASASDDKTIKIWE